MPERLNFKVGIPGEQKRNIPKAITFNNFLNWMAQQSYSEETKARLIEKARTYPVGTLTHFIENISSHLRNIHD